MSRFVASKAKEFPMILGSGVGGSGILLKAGTQVEVQVATKGKNGRSMVSLMLKHKMFACCTDDEAGRPPQPTTRNKRRAERLGRKRVWETIPLG